MLEWEMRGDWGWWGLRGEQPAHGGRENPFWGITRWKLWNGRWDSSVSRSWGCRNASRLEGDWIWSALPGAIPALKEWVQWPEPWWGHQVTCILDLLWFQFSCGTLSNGPGSPGSPLSWPHIERLNYLKTSLPAWLLHSCITLWV